MTLAQLIQTLEELAAEHGEDIEVRLAQQPRWAMQYHVGSIAVADTADREGLTEAKLVLDNPESDEDEKLVAGAFIASQEKEGKILYIGEGTYDGYLSGEAATELGWR